MFEMKIERKWGRWAWSVCDLTGKPLAGGREKSREAARYRAARTLFDLLLSSRLCDVQSTKRSERR